ncbi:MAG: cyclic pyranopterin phosphate synthase [Kiritimatiellia bacterium]|jgi:cyclic pyranopterin phosphate synthase
MAPLTHIDSDGNARMVEVRGKAITDREATAQGRITLGSAALAAVRDRTAKKGDVLAVAQIAGIQAAKRTSDLIPLCHPLPITGVDVFVELDEANHQVVATATVRTTWRTGVEMEALTSVTTALLTVYDMLKAVDKGMQITDVQLLRKSGGRSGLWVRPPADVEPG